MPLNNKSERVRRNGAKSKAVQAPGTRPRVPAGCHPGFRSLTRSEMAEYSVSEWRPRMAFSRCPRPRERSGTVAEVNEPWMGMGCRRRECEWRGYGAEE